MLRGFGNDTRKRRVIQAIGLIAAILLAAPQATAKGITVGAGGALARLPTHAIPRRYSITLVPHLNTSTFDGTETIDLEVREPSRELKLNAVGLQVSQVSLTDLNLAGTAMMDASQQMLTLRFPKPIDIGWHRLKLTFQGSISSTAEGLFASHYRDSKGQRQSILCTEMEPTEARRVLPLWDEPTYRARFALTVQVPADFNAISNMPVIREKLLGGNVKQVEFASTPPMASYLLTLCTGRLQTLDDEVDGVKVRVVTRPGKKEEGHYALGVVRKLIPYYNEYFGYPYPLPKLDLMAVPSGIESAMENWGAVTFNESLLLFNPDHSTQRTREHIFSLVAHELAHQWFGDLVTMAWWDDLWLNEGFATWMEHKVTDRFNPEWDYWQRQNLENQEAMDLDARGTSHAIKQPVRNPGEAASAFDAITYTKAAAVIRMLEAHAGEARFREGVRLYISEHQYANATTADLWATMQRATGQPIAAIASGWVEQPGLPLVKIEARCERSKGRLKLSQERFSITPLTASPQLWRIPVRLAAAGQEPYLLTTRSAELEFEPCSGPINLGSGSEGYYRLEYAPADRVALLAKPDWLTPGELTRLLADSWAFVRAGRVSIVDYLTVVERLSDYRDTAVWEQVLTSLEELDHLQRGWPERSAFRSYASNFLRPLYRRLGWDSKPGEPVAVTSLRSALLPLLGQIDDPTVIAEARRRFVVYTQGSGKLPVELRAPVLSIVGRQADRQTYVTLRQLAERTQNMEQKELLYEALGSANDAELARQSMVLALTDILDPRLASSLMTAVATEGEHPDVSWSFLKAHQQAMLEKQTSFNRFRFVAGIAATFDNAAQSEHLQRWATAHLPPEAKSEIDKAAENILFRERFRKRELPDLAAWLLDRGWSRPSASSEGR